MKTEKMCLGQWNECPESTNVGVCRKYRNCLEELLCMREWLRNKQ